MANEIQKIQLDVNWNVLRGGDIVLTFNEGGTTNISYVDDQTLILADIESVAAFIGNVSVIKNSSDFTIEWINALANTNINEASIFSNSLKRDASTINVSNTQNGVADVSVTPSNTTTTSAVSPVDEIQTINFNGATTGTFDLNGNSTYNTVSTLDDAGIQAAMDAIWGSGNTSVSGGTVTFQGSFAGQPIPEMTVSNNTTDGAPYVATSVEGVTGVHQVDTCTFSGTATGGSMGFNGTSLAYYVDGSTLGFSETVSGTPASGSITTTWDDDYTSHTPYAVSPDSLVIAGQPQIVSIVLADSPTEGYLTAALDGQTSGNFNHSDSSPPDMSIFNWSAGGSAGNWTYTRTINVVDVSASASEAGGFPLLKACGASVSTIQEGAPADDYPPDPNVDLFSSFIQGL